MQFRISDTFTDSLARLTGDEQKAVKTTAFDLQMNPANPGLQFHRIERSKDKHFWSVRAGRDIRVIVHKTDASLLLCFVDHHDKAYQWAEKRKLETHPRTGAAQLVEIRETIREIEVPSYVEPTPQPATPCLAGIVREDLLTYGVPEPWVDDCLAANEDVLLSIAERLPSEAAEALLVLATGGRPEPRTIAAENADPFSHPDALARFRVLDNADELAAALDAPWEKWIVFLHPAQRGFVDRSFNGPARVSGSAGTGKTIVAIHRAAAAMKSNQGHVLLTTFSEELAKSLRQKVKLLVPADRLGVSLPDPNDPPTLVVASLGEIAKQFWAAESGPVNAVGDAELLELIQTIVADDEEVSLSRQFLLDEWNDVVDGWNLTDWPAYRDFKRLGRKTRLRESGRKQVWDVCERLRDELSQQGVKTMAMVYSELAESVNCPFRGVVVVIDSLDWLERLVWDKLCQQYGVESIEKVDGGYARGYMHALSLWREVLDLLNVLRSRGMVVVLIAHSKVERFEDPESSRYEVANNSYARGITLTLTAKQVLSALRDRADDRVRCCV
ncbi:MAG: AAA family ATPase [Rubripirellula sp.]